MGDVWIQMGVIRWPMAFSFLVVLGLSAWSAARVFGAGAADLRTKAWIDAILFWGGFGVVTGVLGTTVGMVIAAQSIEAAGAVHAMLVWGGVRVALLSTVFGILILSVAMLSWFALQMRWRMLLAGTEGPRAA